MEKFGEDMQPIMKWFCQDCNEFKSVQVFDVYGREKCPECGMFLIVKAVNL